MRELMVDRGYSENAHAISYQLVCPNDPELLHIRKLIVTLQYTKANIMGATKNYCYTPTEIDLARAAKALGHPARLAILKALARRKECICGDLVELTHLSQPTVSQHLRELKEVGFIQGTISGRQVCYCLNRNVWQGFLGQLVQEIGFPLPESPEDASSDCC